MKLRRLAFFLLIVVASVGVTLLAEQYGGLTGVSGAEQAILGWRQQVSQQSRVATDSTAGQKSDVVLVLFDSMSVAEWSYLSPFPRPFLAELIDAISGAGAKAIGL